MPYLRRANAVLATVAMCAAFLSAPAHSEGIPLWPSGAPGSEGHHEPEVVRLSEHGEHILSGIHSPSITPRLPAPEAATGAAVIVIPGGGHHEIWVDHEGYRVADVLAAHGIAAFVLRYRLAQEPGSTYTIEGHSVADVARAIRLVRSRAAEWHIDPARVGVIGFSAGGELAARSAASPDTALASAPDPIDRQRSRPDFQALVYPGIPASLVIVKGAPPAFLLAGALDQPKISLGLASLYQDFVRAGVPVELHVYAGVGHGFGIRPTDHGPHTEWPQRFIEWLDAQGFLGRR